MTTYTQEELNEIVRRHGLWINVEDGGERANLRGANLRGANLRGADLRGANLRGANLAGASLRGANLFKANLREANLFKADLLGADLFKADLLKADLLKADLRGADLREADLRGADLLGADLFKADLREATGNCNQVKSMQIEKYTIVLYKDNLSIGCKTYLVDEWFNFSDEDIEKMEKGALEWWNKYKEFIREFVKLSKN